MQLPRHYNPRSNVSELQSVRAGAISPAEAANVQMAKWGAVSSVADAATKVTAVIAESRAEEEYVDGVTSYETRLGDITLGFQNKGYEKDANGQIIDDTEELLKDELNARYKAAQEIRDGMSPMGSKQFDKYIVNSNIRRNEYIRQAANDRRVNALSAQAGNAINNRVAEKNYVGAHARNAAALKAGSIGPAQFHKNSDYIDRVEDSDYFNGILKADDFNEVDAAIAALELSAGRRNGRDIAMTAPEEVGMLNRLNARVELEQSQDNNKIKAAQYANYVIMDGMEDLTEAQLREVALAGLSDPMKGIAKADYDKLNAKLTAPPGALASQGTDPVQYAALAHEINMFTMKVPDVTMQGFSPPRLYEAPAYDWADQYDEMMIDVNNADLSVTDRTRLQTILKESKSVLINDKEFTMNLKGLGDNVRGFKEGSLDAKMNAMDPRFADSINLANDAQLEYFQKRLELGPGKQDQLDVVRKELDTKYKYELGTRSVKKLGISLPYPENHKFDAAWMKEAKVQVGQYLNVNPSISKARSLEGALVQIERISGVNLEALLVAPEKTETVKSGYSN